MVKEFSLRINIVNVIVTTFSTEARLQKSISNRKFKRNITLFKRITKFSMSLNPKKPNKRMCEMMNKNEKKNSLSFYLSPCSSKMMSKVMRKRRWLGNIPKNGIFENNNNNNNNNIFFCKPKNGFFSKSPIFKLAKNRIYSKGRRLTWKRKLPSPPPPSSQPSLQPK